MTTERSASERGQFLSFVLAGEEFAVNILQVKEIIEFDTLTRVPGMPAAVRGVINLRGRVVPIVDLAVAFGLDAAEVSNRSCIVMVETAATDGNTVLGIITDAVSEVLDLDLQSVQPPPSFGTAVGSEFLTGMVDAGRGLIMLLNIDRALSASVLSGESVLAVAAAEPAAN